MTSFAITETSPAAVLSSSFRFIDPLLRSPLPVSELEGRTHSAPRNSPPAVLRAMLVQLLSRAVGCPRRNRPTVYRRRVPLARKHFVSIEEEFVVPEDSCDCRSTGKI
jgi:hypothetical protein